jgi:hypothetical protein
MLRLVQAFDLSIASGNKLGLVFTIFFVVAPLSLFAFRFLLLWFPLVLKASE